MYFTHKQNKIKIRIQVLITIHYSIKIQESTLNLFDNKEVTLIFIKLFFKGYVKFSNNKNIIHSPFYELLQ